MMKRNLNFYGGISENATTTTSSSKEIEQDMEWEMRPGGMLVQKRCEGTEILVRNLSVRIAYGTSRYQISVNSRATFGELKKLMTAETGLQPAEMKLIFKGKEKKNGEYLDLSGVKDRSKVILMEDPECKERRYIEMRKIAKIQTVHRAISDVSMETDRLAEQVSAIEKSIGNGNKVAEIQITTLTEMLMRQAFKLDCIASHQEDATTQKLLQGKRVQKCVETLDMLKVSNAGIKPVIVTTKWETFDPPLSTAAATPSWEFFD